MNNSINERINAVIEQLNISANAFAQELGVAGSVIYNILKGRNKPSFDILDKIVSSFNVNPNYLLTGKGNIIMSNDETIEATNQRYDETDDSYVYFLKQWDKINDIVEKIGKKDSHKYYAGASSMFAECASVMEHYSLMTQTITFLRFAPKNIDNELLTLQVRKMMEYEEELTNLIKPYEIPLAKLYKELEAFNEKHDNVNHMDDEYFDNLLKEANKEK